MAAAAVGSQTNLAVTVRHGFNLNSATIEGSVWQLLGEPTQLNSGALITGDLSVPGTPTVRLNGYPTFSGILAGTGSTQPSSYQVTLNGNAALRYLRTRTDPVALPVVPLPPSTTGTRVVTLNRPTDSAGNFSTVLDLNLKGNAGSVAVPPGTYRHLIANAGTTLVLGVTNSATTAVYHLQSLSLNDQSTLQVVGPVELRLANDLVLGGQAGASHQPTWLVVKIASGNLTLTGGAVFYGQAVLPSGTATLNGTALLVGTVACDRLALNGNGTIRASGPGTPVNQPPTVNAGADLALGYGQTATLTGTASDDGLPNGTLTVSWSQVSGPGTVTFANAAAANTTATFSVAGAYTLRLTASDSALTASDDVVVSVTPVNQAPVAFSQSLTNLEDTAQGLVLQGSDPNGDPLTFAVLTQPSFGTLTGTPPSLSYRPNTNFHGSDSFTFRVNDGALNSAAATVSLTVLPVNDAPVATAQTVTNLEDTPFGLTLTATDVDSPSLSFSLVTLPAHGTLTGTPPNLTYRPATNYTGSDSFTFQANDGQLDSAPATITLLIQAVNDAPMVSAGLAQLLNFANPHATLAGSVADDNFFGPPTTIWSQVSGPGTVTFGDVSVTNTTATFSAPGVYVLRLSGDDGFFLVSDTVTSTVNAAPAVTLPATALVNYPGTLTLNGTVTDDGLPANTLTVGWSIVSGPGTVIFSQPAATNTDASFSQAGQYLLRLTGNDGAATGSAEVTVTVNAVPVVEAGPEQTVTITTGATLAGTVTDDGQPLPLMATWSLASGPGAVLFAHPTNLATTATFTQPGTYRLRLSASDGAAAASDDVMVSVTAPGANQPPVVNAGPNQVIGYTSNASLNGTASDDGLPNGGLMMTWSKVSGPGAVTFANTGAANTMATFNAAGTYTLQLLADDGEFQAISQVFITVYPDNLPPVLNAGAEVVSAAGTVVLHGDARDDGLPANTLTVGWSVVSGPGQVTFANPSAGETTASFSAAGTYVLRLTASDSQFVVTDELTVTVTGNQAPSVNAGPDQIITLTGSVTGLGPAVFYSPSPDDWRYEVSQPGLDFFVQMQGMASDGTNVYVVGPFSSAGGQSFPNGQAIWDGCNWKSFPPGLTRSAFVPQTITVKGPELFAGGFFTGVDANANAALMVRYDGTNWLRWQPAAPGSGLGSGYFTDRVLSSCQCPVSSAVYAGGEFYFALTNGGPVCSNIAKWNGTSWEQMGTGLSSSGANSVKAVAVAPNGDVYAAGNIDTLLPNGDLCRGVARWDGTNWNPVGLGFSGAHGFIAETEVYALAFGPDGQLYAAGNFLQVGTSAVNFVARWDGTNWNPLGSGLNTKARCLAFRGNDLYVGGEFSLAGGTPASRVARWDGTNWFPLSGGVDQTVQSMVNTVGGLYLGGVFNFANGQPANYIAKWGPAEPPVVTCPNPVVIQTNTTQPVPVALTLPVSQPCGNPLTVTWNVDGSPVQVDTLAAGTTTNTLNVSYTGQYAPGVHTVTIVVQDNAGGTTTCLTSVTIATPTVANLPGVVTDDGLPVGGPLSSRWSLVSGPASVTFANAFTPATSVNFTQAGTYVLRLEADDSALTNASVATITVITPSPTNQPPVVVAGPDQTILQFQLARLGGSVVDDGLPGGPVTTLWSQISGPAAAAIQSPASLQATVAFTAPGAYALRLTATDGALTSSSDLTITVTPVVNQPPVVTVPAAFGVVLPDVALLPATVTDDGVPFGILNPAWTQTGGPGSVLFRSSNGVTYAAFSTNGTYQLTLLASDGLASSSNTVTVTAYPASFGPVPVVAITSPDDSVTVTAPTTVIGTVQSAILQSYALQYRLKTAEEADPQPWLTLVTGSNNVTAGPLGTFDPTLLLNGIYEIHLTATDLVGRTTTSEVITWIADRNLKIGQFAFSFNDLTVPVAGIPITITRSYDSRDKRVGDFGVGWTLDLQNIRLQKNRHQGRNWEETSSGVIFPVYQLQTSRACTVTITFPNGKVHKFLASPTPAFAFGIPIAYPRMTYLPFPDTRGTLVPMQEIGGDLVPDDQLVFGAGIPGVGDFISYELLLNPPPGPADNILFNPDLFEFKSAEGYTYLLSATNGLRKLTDPSGNTLTITTNGILSSAGKSVTFERDALGRITNIVDAAGQAMRYVYDTNGNLAQFIDREGNTNSFTYDGRHNLLAATDARGITPALNTYDPAGRLTQHTDAFGQTIQYTHDIAGRREMVRDRLGRETVHIYDDNGNVLSTTAPDGGVTLSTYDANDNLLTVTDPLGRTTTYRYDAQDNRTNVVDALGNSTSLTYEYDQLGRRTKRTLPGGQFESFGYDTVGNLASRTDANGFATTYFYDTLNRLLSRVPDARLGQTTVAFTYNALGQRTLMTDASGTTTYAYDLRNRLTTKATPQGTLGYGYDAAGNLTNLVSGNVNGTAVGYEYDALNRLSAVNDSRLGRTTYSYDAVGNLESFILPNSVHAAYQYDSLNLLTNLAGGKTVTALANYAYTVGAAGNRLAATESLFASVLNPVASSFTRTWEYDPLYRLTNETVQASQPAAQGALTYSYDPVGNRLARYSTMAALLGQSFSFDANDRLTGDTYDANGNTTYGRLVTGGAMAADAYDFEDRLVNRNSGQVTIGYDGDGNRVRKTVGGVTTLYLVDTLNPTGYAQVVEEISNAGGPAEVTRTYTWGHSLLLQDQLLGTNWTASFYGYDGHGSVRYLTDGAGQVTDTFDYDAFGTLIARTGTTPNLYLFTGQQFDPDLGLYYLRARYHNPDSGRFWTADSFEGFASDPASLHRYTFNHNDPGNRFDPSGNISFGEQITVTALAPGVTKALYDTIPFVVTPDFSEYVFSLESVLTAQRSDQAALVALGGLYLANQILGRNPAETIGGWVRGLRVVAGTGASRLTARTLSFQLEQQFAASFIVGRLKGQIVDVARMERMSEALWRQHKVNLISNADSILNSESARVGKNLAAFFDPRSNAIYTRSQATLYEVMHEVRHAVDFKRLGPDAWRQLSEFDKEKLVYDWIKNQNWLSDSELAHAYLYIAEIARREGRLLD